MRNKMLFMTAIMSVLIAGVVLAQQTPPDVGPTTRALIDAQIAYRARTGRYAQVTFYPTPTPMPPGLIALLDWMPGAVVQDTSHAPLPPEFSAVPIPDALDVTTNVYTSPAGSGYEIVYRAGNLIRVEVAGPEIWRAHDWRVAWGWGISPLASPLEVP